VTRNGRIWVVYLDADAARDFEAVKSKGDRIAVYQAIEKLRFLGPALSSPNMKSLKGEADLFELRPKRGAVAVRPIYARIGDAFVILAVASDKKHFDRAIKDARSRLIEVLRQK
jgi:hypothetical protein